jgi:hypothetical protein
MESLFLRLFIALTNFEKKHRFVLVWRSKILTKRIGKYCFRFSFVRGLPREFYFIDIQAKNGWNI